MEYSETYLTTFVIGERSLATGESQRPPPGASDTISVLTATDRAGSGGARRLVGDGGVLAEQMTRRGSKATTHVHRMQPQPGAGQGQGQGEAHGRGKHDLLLHRHRLLRRTASFVLARKYRFSYPSSRFECVLSLLL